MLEKMKSVTASPAIAIVGAGATLANPGGPSRSRLKEISELNPSRSEYVVDWLFFALVSLLPLAVALILLLVARDWTGRLLEATRGWLELHARTIAAVIIVAVAVALARNGIAGLTGYSAGYAEPTVSGAEAAAPIAMRSAGWIHASASAIPPASAILSRSGIAHRCSMSTTAALASLGDRVREIPHLRLVEDVAVLEFRGADADCLHASRASCAQTDERTDQRADVHRLLLRQVAPLDDLELATLRVRHEKKIDDPDHALLLQPFQLRQDRSVEAGPGRTRARASARARGLAWGSLPRSFCFCASNSSWVRTPASFSCASCLSCSMTSFESPPAAGAAVRGDGAAYCCCCC